MDISTLKKEARFAIKEHFGTIIGTMVLFVLISIMFNLLIGQNVVQDENGSYMLTVGGFILSIVMTVCELVLAAGVTNTIVKVSSNEKCGPTEFINHSVKHIFKILAIYFRIFIKALVVCVALFILLLLTTALLMYVFNLTEPVVKIVSTILSMLILLALILVILPYSFSFIILSESPKEKTKDIIKASKALFKDNAIDYLIVLLSFIGWFILYLVAITVIYYFVAIGTLPGIIYNLFQYVPTVFITPYIIATQYAFFEDVYAVKRTDSKKDSKPEEVKE